MKEFFRFTRALALLFISTAVWGCAGSGVHESNQDLPLPLLSGAATKPLVGFNGETTIFPAMDTFYSAASVAGTQTTRRCHAYVSWDLVEHAIGHGTGDGTRAWFEAWLKAAQGHCDEALITFKYVAGFSNYNTVAGTWPANADYETAVVAFMNTNWSYTGWTGSFVYTAWNEPNNGASSGDGLTTQLPAQVAADYYLILRKHCVPSSNCIAVAGDFGSNGQMFLDYVKKCSGDASAAPCSNSSYLDTYKHYLVVDAPTFGLATDNSFRPERFAYHGWDDANNYINLNFINKNDQCPEQPQCTTTTLLNSMTGDSWDNVEIWDSEVAAGQDPNTSPDDTVQACTVSFLLRLSTIATHRITRIYYTHPVEAGGVYWSLFNANGATRPAFNVLATLNTSYTPTGSEHCP